MGVLGCYHLEVMCECCVKQRRFYGEDYQAAVLKASTAGWVFLQGKGTKFAWCPEHAREVVDYNTLAARQEPLSVGETYILPPVAVLTYNCYHGNFAEESNQVRQLIGRFSIEGTEGTGNGLWYKVTHESGVSGWINSKALLGKRLGYCQQYVRG